MPRGRRPRSDIGPDAIASCIRSEADIVVKVPDITDIMRYVSTETGQSPGKATLYRHYGSLEQMIGTAGLKSEGPNIANFKPGNAPAWVVDKAVAKFGDGILLDPTQSQPATAPEAESLHEKSTAELHAISQHIAEILLNRPVES